MHCCTTVSSHTVVIASGSAFEPVADGDAHVLDAAVLQLGQHLQPELGALAAVAGPQTRGCRVPRGR